jgi:hypothetical protein
MPPAPQLLFAMPGEHWFAAVQQPAQLPGPHLSTHFLPVHTWLPIVQSLHEAPPVPHALSCVPTTHTLPEQQPFGHVAGPHAGLAHAPPWQTSPIATQLPQFIPPTPQAVSCVPTAQMLPTQQPRQLPGLQRAAGWQTPGGTQVSFTLHGLHIAPPVPHSAVVGFAMHVLPRQQPLQFAGPHVIAGWHVRSFGWPLGTQTSPIALQLAHGCPPLPHAVLSVPPAHVWPTQQPPQFAGPQLAVPWQTPPPPPAGLHVWPRSAQSSQLWPNCPHDVLDVPGRHLSPTQQPVQFDASHF